MDIMYRIHTALGSLREHLTWNRGNASQQNNETSEISVESSNANRPITEEESSGQAFDVGDRDDHIIATFNTHQPPYSAPSNLKARDRIPKGFFKLLSPNKNLAQDVEKLQMSIMYPPGSMPLNPIVELDEQAPESLNDDNVLTPENRMEKKIHYLKSVLKKVVINATQFKLFWEPSADTTKSYGNGIYWVCYAAPGGKFVYLCH